MHRVEGQPLSTIFREAIQIYQQLELEESHFGRPTTDTRRIQFAEPRNIKSREADIDSLSYRSDSWKSPPPRDERAPRNEPPRSPRYEPPQPPRYEPSRGTTGPNHRVKPADRFCRYSKVPKHDIHECRKREFNNSLRSGNGPTFPSRNERKVQLQRVQTVTQANELQVASLRLTENNSIPCVKLNSPQLKGLTEFTVDTGAEPNLIKVSMLKEGTVINAKDRSTLQGITERQVKTLGSTQMKISEKAMEFHVVPDSFPIATEGLLKTSFCLSDYNFISGAAYCLDIIIPFSNNAVTIPVAYIPLPATGLPIAFVGRQQWPQM